MTPTPVPNSSDRKKPLPRALLAAPLAMLATAVWFATHPIQRPTDWKSDPRAVAIDQRERKDVEAAAKAAADYIVRNCDAYGKFTYRAYANGDQTELDDYNIVRHAGAMYSLGMYEEWQPSPATRQALVRSTKFIKTFMGPVGPTKEMLTVWNQPNTPTPKVRAGVLGGSGLGLVGLLSAEKWNPGTTSIEDLRRLGEFILFMQKPDGGFNSRYSSQTGRSDKFNSLYYPGEAALGLVMLYERDPQPRWLDNAVRALSYLATVRKGQKKVPADHWALLASQRILKHLPDSAPEKRAEIITHAIQICDAILVTDANAGVWTPPGSLTNDGRTTPTSTRLEGLLAALTFLPANEMELTSRLRVVTRDGVNFLVRSQIKSGKYRGGIPGEMASVNTTNPQTIAYRAEIRIDYVQHALSAMLSYLHQTK